MEVPLLLQPVAAPVAALGVGGKLTVRALDNPGRNTAVALRRPEETEFLCGGFLTGHLFFLFVSFSITFA
jgi:hypothetical protein